MAKLLMLVALARGLAGQSTGRAPTVSRISDTANLRNAVLRVARESQGHLGVGIELLESGDRLAVDDGIQHPMQSVYKVPIAMAALHAVDDHKLALDDEVDVRRSDFISAKQHSPIRDAHPDGDRTSLRELLRFAVSESDGTAGDVLLRLLGGPPRVMRYLTGIGVRAVEVVTTEKAIGLDDRVQYEDWTSPEGSLGLLRALFGHRSLADSSRKFLLRLMTESKTGLLRLRGLLPEGTVVAHKTGSSNTSDGMTAAANDVGIITLPNGCHLAVVVLLTDSRADEASRDSTIAHIARIAWDHWTELSRGDEFRRRCTRTD